MKQLFVKFYLRFQQTIHSKRREKYALRKRILYIIFSQILIQLFEHTFTNKYTLFIFPKIVETMLFFEKIKQRIISLKNRYK